MPHGSSSGQGATSADSAQTAVVTAQPPVNTIAPSITGTAKDGQTLSVSNGTWTGSATITYSRQWKRCDSAGANCTNISGATGTSYTLTGADVGARIKVTVTATNSAGNASSDASPTTVVSGAAPANTALPTITGTAKDGQTLTAGSGTWTGSAPITYGRQWQRCNSTGGSCIAIAGATDVTYTLTASDVGKRIRVAVTATNTTGSATATSAASGTVAAIPPANLTLPSITGTVKENFDVFTTTGTWSGSGAFSYSYQWQLCDSAGSNCSDIGGATFDGITIPHDYLGLTVRVMVTASNSAGSATATSAVSAPITTSPPVVDRNATVALDASTLPYGDTNPSIPIWGATFGQIEATWYGTQPISVTYQWQRCDAAGDNCTDLPDETAKRYRTVADDNGKRLRIRLTATNSLGTTTVTTDPGALITDGSPTNTAPPTLSGTPRNHFTLTADPGTWSGPLSFSHRYEWSRCDAAGDNCDPVEVDNHYSPDYELTDADVGHRIKAHVFAVTSRAGSIADTDLSSVVASGSTKPTVALSGDLVADPHQWLDGDSYGLTVSATAGSDASGLTSVAVMYDGEQIASYGGCDGAGCSVSQDLDIDTSDVADGTSALWVVVTDTDHTETVEKRDIHVNRETPLSPSRVLVDMAPDGSTKLTWRFSNSPDAVKHQIYRRLSPDEPFTLIGTTENDFYIDQPSGNGSIAAPLARMSAAHIGLSADAPAGGDHAEYEIRAVDEAGWVSEPSSPVEATATDVPAPAPSTLQVVQAGDYHSVEVTWGAAPGAQRYALFRALDGDIETLANGGGGTKGTPELIADVPASVTDFSDTPMIEGRYTYTVRAVSPTGQLGEATAGTTVNATPTRVPPSQEVLDHIRDIGGFLDDGGAPDRERIPCSTKCKLLRAGERALEKTGRTAAKVVDQLAKTRGLVGVMPKLARFSVAGLLIEEDAKASWKFGTRLRKAYFTEKVPPPTPEIHERRLVHAGEIAGTWACTPDWYNSACIGNGGTAIIGHLRAPSDGGTIAVGRTEGDNQILFTSWNHECSADEPAPAPEATLPGGWRWLTDTGPCPMWWNATAQHWVPYQPTRTDTPVAQPDGPSEGEPYVPVPKPGIDETIALDHLLHELQDKPELYSGLIAWLEHELGNDDAGETPDGTPACSGMTYLACVSAFEHAGFEGPFVQEVLTPDQAWVGLPGGAVVDTTPWPDDIPDDVDGVVRIRTNPAVMPPWTAEDEEVDQHLRDEQDTSTKRNEDMDVEVFRKNVSRQCRIRVLAEGSGRTLSDCWTMPKLITGGLDAYGPAENDTEALIANPRWVGLNRRPYVPNDRWYEGQPGPAGGCVRPKPYFDGECHEYPFWSTQQHGAGQAENYGPLALGRPFISWTHHDQNTRQGQVLKRFYGAADTDRFRFTGCEIPYTPDPPLPLTDIERFALSADIPGHPRHDPPHA